MLKVFFTQSSELIPLKTGGQKCHIDLMFDPAFGL